MRNNGKFTLIELILIIVVVGIAMPPLAMMFYESLQRSSDTYLTSTSAQLANSLMEEIKTRKWDETTPDEGGKAVSYSAIGIDAPGETRPAYDDIDDYNAISNQSPPHDALDQTLSDFSSYTRSVDVEYVDCIAEVFGPVVFPATTSDHKRVTVTVSSSAGSIKLVSIFSNR